MQEEREDKPERAYKEQRLAVFVCVGEQMNVQAGASCQCQVHGAWWCDALASAQQDATREMRK